MRLSPVQMMAPSAKQICLQVPGQHVFRVQMATTVLKRAWAEWLPGGARAPALGLPLGAPTPPLSLASP
jgi:hypothetical protein